MIVKFFELKKKRLDNYNLFLLYGNNKGFIEETIESFIKPILSKNIFNYDESEILKDIESFMEEIQNKSFFENDKLIIISRVTDKIYKLIDEILEKKIIDLSIILKAGSLEKKSKIRNFFEKNKETICIPFYEDNVQSLTTIASNYFRDKKINISQENINLLVNKTGGDRINLKNELEKINAFVGTKKKINTDEIIKLTNLVENFNVSDLVDSSLMRNKRRTLNIINENIFSIEDNILILRVYLAKLKRLLKIKKETLLNKNVDAALLTFKPPIFWKDKDVIKQQIKIWTYDKIQELIIKTNNTEYLIKKNPSISNNLITNFILQQTEN